MCLRGFDDAKAQAFYFDDELHIIIPKLQFWFRDFCDENDVV